MKGAIKRSGPEIIHERTFRSRELYEHFGDPVFEYEPVTIPAKYLESRALNEGEIQYERKASRVIGRPTEQNRSEKRILQADNNWGALASITDPTDDIPLFSYETSFHAQQQLTDRGSPINLAWSDGPASEIRSWMEEFGWTQFLQIFDEYTVDQYINQGGNLIETDAHVMDAAYSGVSVTSIQDHIRLYDLSGTVSGVSVVGQVHHDPFDHNKIGENIGELPSGSWEFSDSRDRAADLWNSNDSSHDVGDDTGPADVDRWYAGNTHDGTDSHDGKVAEIHNDGFGIPDDDDSWPPIIILSEDEGDLNRNQSSNASEGQGNRQITNKRQRPCACMLGF
ncbi:hypothetical protein [Salinarchaeum chitinilyticum]